jgi:hypothetical protein
MFKSARSGLQPAQKGAQYSFDTVIKARLCSRSKTEVALRLQKQTGMRQ